MPSVLIVCTANICRSPMAEALARRLLCQQPEPAEWQVSSAGTWASDGRGASVNAVKTMSDRGLDINRHRSRQVNADLLASSDLILTMTAGHAEALRAEFPEHASRVHRLAEMAGLPYDVADPYGGSPEEYRQTADELERLLARGLPAIVREAHRARAGRDR